MARKNRTKGLMDITARAMMLLAAFLLFLTYASMVVNPAKAWYMTVVGLLFVPMVLLNLLLLVWALRRKSGAFLIPLLALIPAVIFIDNLGFDVGSGCVRGGVNMCDEANCRYFGADV